MRLLSHDVDILRENFPSAYAHVKASMLREECFSLLCYRHNGGDMSKWYESRLEELLKTPACQQHNFLSITENMRKK